MADPCDGAAVAATSLPPAPFQRLLQHGRRLSDPGLAAQLLRAFLPLDEFSQLPAGEPWQSDHALLSVGSLELLVGRAHALRLRVAERSRPLLCLGFAGEQRFRQAGRRWPCGPDRCVLLSHAPFSCDTTAFCVVAFELDPIRLLRTAAAMGGLTRLPPAWRQRLEEPHAWQLPADPLAPSLHRALRDTLLQGVQLAGHGTALLERLGFDDQIHRLLAAMVIPELREEEPLHRVRRRDLEGRDAFDELLDWIRHNLDQPLTLTDLELRSHYSRRALQYAFRLRLGCTASQWIRQQRLDQALQRLQNPGPADSVGTIAQACGYRSMSLFSVEFQQRFHVKPSQLLREARAAGPGLDLP